MTTRSRPPDVRTLQHGAASRTDESIREALDGIVLDSIPTVVTGLAVLYAVLAGTYPFVLSPPAAGPMSVSAGVSAGLLVCFRLALGRWNPPSRLAHPLGAAVAFLILANSLLHLHLTGEARFTTNLILLVLGVGLVFLDVGWFAVVLAAVFTGWLWTLAGALLTPSWLHFGLALAGAAILASAMLAIRIRTFGRIEELHFEDRMKQLELESALARTEAARRGEREAREALEEAVDRLRESEERFRRLAEATFEGVVIHQDGEIVDASSRAAELFGRRSPDELVGRRLDALVADGDRERVRDFVAEAEEGRDGAGGGAGESAPALIEVEGKRSDGTRFPMELSGARAGFRGRSAAVTVLRDVTDRREAEEMLRQAAREADAANRAKSTFLATMSHELRTPLNAVIGFSNLLLKNRSGQLDRTELSYLQRVVSNGRHLLDLIGDVLDLSKIEAGRTELTPEEVDVGELVAECVRSVEVEAGKKGLALDVELPDRAEPLLTDRQRLRQVLLNLVGNAVKFTEEGRVTVRLRVDPESARPRRIEVEDTGIGIAPDRLEEIFEAFRQADATTARRFGGTGLGLTISRSLCEILGFRLEVESEEGAGSRFSVLLGP